MARQVDQARGQLGTLKSREGTGDDVARLKAKIERWSSEREGILREIPRLEDQAAGLEPEMERLRKEIQNVKRQAKDREKKTRLKIPKLRDCKFHLNDARPKKGEFLGEKSMIFLTEGQSASGSVGCSCAAEPSSKTHSGFTNWRTKSGTASFKISCLSAIERELSMTSSTSILSTELSGIRAITDGLGGSCTIT